MIQQEGTIDTQPSPEVVEWRLARAKDLGVLVLSPDLSRNIHHEPAGAEINISPEVPGFLARAAHFLTVTQEDLRDAGVKLP